MKNKLLIDSNIFLSYLLKDSEFEKSRKILENIIRNGDEIYVNQFVIEEIFTVSVYKIGLSAKKVVFSFLKDL
jgi:predicted nucleic acid-binding protein